MTIQLTPVNKGRLYGGIIAFIAFVIAFGLTALTFDANPGPLLVLLALAIIIHIPLLIILLRQYMLMAFMRKGFTRLITISAMVLIFTTIIMADLFLLPMGIQALLLQAVGETAQAEIIDRQVETYSYHTKQRERYRIRFTWNIVSNGEYRGQGYGEETASLSEEEHIEPGTMIAVRYIPESPNVFRVEEAFAASSLYVVSITLWTVITFSIYSFVSIMHMSGQMQKEKRGRGDG